MEREIYCAREVGLNLVPGTDTKHHERFLHRIHTETNDKIVLISNYTQTLDIFEKLLRGKK